MHRGRSICWLVAVGLLASCAKVPSPLVKTETFAPCPPSPNCVSSDAIDSRHAIAAFALAPGAAQRWPEIRTALLSLPRLSLTSEGPRYLRAQGRSAVLGFIDDLELQLRPREGIVAVRSASRSGYYDFGVNRRRVEQLRRLLQARGLVRPAR